MERMGLELVGEDGSIYLGMHGLLDDRSVLRLVKTWSGLSWTT